MAKAHTGYMVDCFYQDGVSIFRRESFHVKAPSDDVAISEAKHLAPTKKPHHWQLRAVRRSGDTVICKSPEGGGTEKP